MNSLFGPHSVKVMRAGAARGIRTRSFAVVSIVLLFPEYAGMELEISDGQNQGDKTSVSKLCAKSFGIGLVSFGSRSMQRYTGRAFWTAPLTSAQFSTGLMLGHITALLLKF